MTALEEFTETETVEGEFIENLSLQKGKRMALTLVDVTKETMDFNSSDMPEEARNPNKIEEHFVLHLLDKDVGDDVDPVKYKFSRKLTSPVFRQLKEDLKDVELPVKVMFFREPDNFGTYKVWVPKDEK